MRGLERKRSNPSAGTDSRAVAGGNGIAERTGVAEGDGLLFLALLAASWVIAVGVGWVVWRVVPL